MMKSMFTGIQNIMLLQLSTFHSSVIFQEITVNQELVK